MLMDLALTLPTFALALADAPAPTPAGTAELFTIANLIAVITLSAMEIVLGIDNVVFVAIIAGRAKPEDRDRVRKIGLMLGVVLRIVLLFSIGWIASLTEPLFTVMEKGFTGKDLVLLCGGIFLLYKSVKEIHHKVEGIGEHPATAGAQVGITFGSAIAQIAVIDLVFSLDSVITAVGMVQNIWIMVIAVLLSAVVMITSSGPIARFVDRHPTIKMLALSFLILIGVMLVAEGCGQHFNKGYIYFAMAFSLAVELLNMKIRSKTLANQAAKSA
jgi:predicted tellurium resistance membrane protein TerC